MKKKLIEQKAKRVYRKLITRIMTKRARTYYMIKKSENKKMTERTERSTKCNCNKKSRINNRFAIVNKFAIGIYCIKYLATLIQ